MTMDITIRPALPEENGILADAYFKMWLDNGMTTADFMGNWSDVTLAFMKKAEENNKGRAFVAEAKDTVIGTAQCMINRKLNPRALRREIRTDGYIWSVYVDPIHRR